MNNQLRRFDSRRNFLPSFFGVRDDFFNNFFEGNSLPAANVSENENSFKVELSVPGFEKNDFKIEIEKNVLTISASKENSKEEKDENERIIRQEFSSSSFSRSFILPKNIDTDKIEASQKDGVLSLSLPKKEKNTEEGVKKIEIR